MPFPFFVYEFFTSNLYNNLVRQVAALVEEMSKCKSAKSFIMAYMKAIMYAMLFVLCFLLWPVMGSTQSVTTCSFVCCAFVIFIWDLAEKNT